MKVSAYLEQTYNKIKRQEAWTRYWLARNGDGLYCAVDSEEAVCWCLIGAMDSIVLTYSKAFPLETAEMDAIFHRAALILASIVREDEVFAKASPGLAHHIRSMPSLHADEMLSLFNDRSKHGDILELLKKGILKAKEQEKA